MVLEVSLNSSFENMHGFMQPLTRAELAMNFCTDFRHYFLTILLIFLTYLVYDDIIRPAVNRAVKAIRNDKIRIWLQHNLNCNATNSLYVLSFTGFMIITYFYKDWMTTPQRAWFLIIITWLAGKRLVELLGWIKNRLIGYLRHKGMKEVADMYDGMLSGGEKGVGKVKDLLKELSIESREKDDDDDDVLIDLGKKEE